MHGNGDAVGVYRVEALDHDRIAVAAAVAESQGHVRDAGRSDGTGLVLRAAACLVEVGVGRALEARGAVEGRCRVAA